jgi:AmmeMemoRadiSam system protein B
MQAPLRKAAVAGSWYPGEPEELADEVESHLRAAARASVPGRLVALISPHAGLRYSGPVAAHGYGLLRGRASLRVVLVGPSHHMAFPGSSVFARGEFETPFGRIPIDEDLAGRLIAADPGIVDDPAAHRSEHSLEMQLPFLQHLVGELRIVPVLMGTQAREDVDSLAAALVSALGTDDVLMVASSDLSHYHPAPKANALDSRVVEDVERFDPDALMSRLEGYHGHACGGGPMVAVMKAARGRGADVSTILKYADSGDAGDKDKSRVVGYVSAALSAREA